MVRQTWNGWFCCHFYRVRNDISIWTFSFMLLIYRNISKLEEGIGEKLGLFIYFESIFVCGIIMALIRGWKLTLVCLISLPLSSAIMGGITWVSDLWEQCNSIVPFEFWTNLIHTYLYYILLIVQSLVKYGNTVELHENLDLIYSPSSSKLTICHGLLFLRIANSWT